MMNYFRKILEKLLRKTKIVIHNPSSLIIRWKLKSYFNSQLIIPEDKTGKDLFLPRSYYDKKKLRYYPTISIVTPSYNQFQYIERTINSVIKQEYPFLEYIIQDGNSSDATIQILKKYHNHFKHWESKPDKGQAQAINLGFHHSSGEIMAYLNSDDLLLPSSLHYVANYFENHPEVDVVYGHRIMINENDLEIGRWVLPAHSNKIVELIDWIPQETLFWRRSIWNKAGGKIDESFQFTMDWDLIIRFQQASAKIIRLPRFIGAFRVHQQQKTLTRMEDVGAMECIKIRDYIHKRPLSDLEIQLQVEPYICKHRMLHKLYAFNYFFSKKINFTKKNLQNMEN